MKPAGTRLAEAMDAIEFKTPTIPVVHNVHAQTEDDPVRIKALLGEQIYSPVQWTLCVQAIVDSGASEVVECGPGKVLSGLSRRIDKSLQSYSLEDPEQLRQTITELS
jgi:[acyl-carrier-protein] S-malonyltransferase